MFNDVQLQQQQKSSINSASYSSPEKNHGNKSPVEDKGVRISGTMPAISKSFSPIGRNIVIPPKQNFSEKHIS